MASSTNSGINPTTTPSTSDRPPFEQLVAGFRWLIEAYAEDVAPAGEWPHRALFIRGRELFSVPLEPLGWNSGDERDEFLQLGIPRLAEEFDANVLALIEPAWYLDPDDDPGAPAYLDKGLPVAAHPLRRECVSLTVLAPERLERWLVEVHRQPHQTPTTGIWFGPCNDLDPVLDPARAALSA